MKFILLHRQLEGWLDKMGVAQDAVEHSVPDVRLMAVFEGFDGIEQIAVCSKVVAVQFPLFFLFGAFEKASQLLERRLQSLVRTEAEAEYGFVCCHGDAGGIPAPYNTDLQGCGQGDYRASRAPKKRTKCIIFFTLVRFFDINEAGIGHYRRGRIFLSEKEYKRSRGIQRYRLTSQRTFSMGVIAFAQPTRIEYVVRIVDFSVVGVGIEMAERIEPGLVYFKEPVGGQKFGVLVWSKHRGDRYRAGIKFVVLSSEQEEYLRSR